MEFLSQSFPLTYKQEELSHYSALHKVFFFNSTSEPITFSSYKLVFCTKILMLLEEDGSELTFDVE